MAFSIRTHSELKGAVVAFWISQVGRQCKDVNMFEL